MEPIRPGRHVIRFPCHLGSILGKGLVELPLNLFQAVLSRAHVERYLERIHGTRAFAVH